MNLSIFREYDIRGVHPTELTDDTVRRIAMAFGTILRGRGLKRISVGGDVRLHTPRAQGDLHRRGRTPPASTSSTSAP